MYIRQKRLIHSYLQKPSSFFLLFFPTLADPLSPLFFLHFCSSKAPFPLVLFHISHNPKHKNLLFDLDLVMRSKKKKRNWRLEAWRIGQVRLGLSLPFFLLLTNNLKRSCMNGRMGISVNLGNLWILVYSWS